MKITHLVTNGCSWTYGQGLDNIKEEAWAAILARKLGCEIVNIAVPGTGNEAITRRNYEYIYEGKSYGARPLFVVVFSQIWRREVWMRNYYGTKCGDYCTMFPAHETDGNPVERSYLEEFNEEDFLRKNMLIKSATKNLLENFQFPHIITQFQGDGVQPSSVNDVKQRFPNWYDQYVKMNDIDEISGQVHMLDKTHCQHPGPKAQEVIAEMVYSAIIKKYGILEVENRPYLKLKDFKLKNPNNDVHNHVTAWL